MTKKIAIEPMHCIIGIVFLSLIVLFYRNRVLDKELKILRNNHNNQASSILQSLMDVDKFYGLDFPIGRVCDIVNKNVYLTDFKQTTIVWFFSRQSCGACVDTQIEILQELYETKKKNSNFDLICIGLLKDEIELMKLKKAKKIEFPILLDYNGIFHDCFNNKFKNLLFLIDKNQKIIRINSPIIGNLNLIENNFLSIKRYLF